MTTKQQFLTLALATGFAVGASGQTVTKVAASNATIRSGGDTGTPWFHNAQVPGAGFESYAVSSFSFSAADFGLATLSGVSVVTISYMQSNAFFTSDGPIELFVSFDATVASGDYTGLTHSGTGAGLDDTQFSDSPSTQSLGTGTFTEVSDGHVDTYTLDFTGTMETNLVNAINSGSSFSLILGAPSGSTAATYAGIQSFDYASNGNPTTGQEPDSKLTTLSITAVPEPGFYAAIFGLLALGLAIARRSRA